jgi:hypothetical protein
MPKLTNAFIKKIEPPEKGQKLLWDTGTKGFGVRATPGGKVFIVQGRVNGSDRRVKIASCDTFSADEARKRAKELLQCQA